MVDVADKLAYFQAVTGLDDPDLCTEILAAHGWDLELAISSLTGSNSHPSDNASAGTTSNVDGVTARPQSRQVSQQSEPVYNAAASPGLAWKLVTLPISVISGSLGLISGAIGLGLWAAGGVLSYSLGMVGLGSGLGRDGESSTRLVSVSASMH